MEKTTHTGLKVNGRWLPQPTWCVLLRWNLLTFSKRSFQSFRICERRGAQLIAVIKRRMLESSQTLFSPGSVAPGVFSTLSDQAAFSLSVLLPLCLYTSICHGALKPCNCIVSWKHACPDFWTSGLTTTVCFGSPVPHISYHTVVLGLGLFADTEVQF